MYIYIYIYIRRISCVHDTVTRTRRMLGCQAGILLGDMPGKTAGIAVQTMRTLMYPLVTNNTLCRSIFWDTDVGTVLDISNNQNI